MFCRRKTLFTIRMDSKFSKGKTFEYFFHRVLQNRLILQLVLFYLYLLNMTFVTTAPSCDCIRYKRVDKVIIKVCLNLVV